MKYYHTELSDAHFTLSHLSTSGQVFTYWQASPGKFAEAFTTNSNLKVPNIIRLVATRLESKVFSLERLYPSYPMEVSKSQTNIKSTRTFGSKEIGQ